jgi:transposase
MHTEYKIAGVDVHKHMLAVVVVDSATAELSFQRRKFGTMHSELQHLLAWLQQQGVQQVVMESTAQYWKPVWQALEGHLGLHLAQARSNLGPRGRKTDFRDAERLVSRFLSGDLILSFVPEPEQRMWRSLSRNKQQLTRDRIRLHSQVESLLEEMQMKLSSVISDLLGASGRRILGAIARGEDDPIQLAKLGDERLRATPEQLQDALQGQPHQLYRDMLQMFLDRLDLIEAQRARLEMEIAHCLRAHQDAVLRLAELPGVGVDAAQQIIAEVGPQAAAFASAAQLASWVGVCPGRQESAGESSSNRSPKGNRTLRRLLNQLAHAAVRKNGCHLQVVFQRLLPKLRFKGAIWAIAHKLCRLIWKVLHQGVRYIEYGPLSNPRARQQYKKRLLAKLVKLGYSVTLIDLYPEPNPQPET